MRNWLLGLSAILLSACSSAPVNVQYYLLDEPDLNADIAVTKVDKKLVQAHLDKLMLAKYLRQNKLAILEDNQVYFANQHLWAQALNQGIASALANDVNLGSKVNLMQPNEPGHDNSDYAVQIAIEHLVATQDNQAILQGKFWILSDKQVVKSEVFKFSIGLQQDGFSHSVKQQRALVGKLAQQLQSALISL